MRLRYFYVYLLILFLGCLPLPPAKADSAPLPEKIPLYFFHETACGSCDGTDEFWIIADEVLADVQDIYPYTIHTTNVFQTGGMASFEKLTDQIGLSRENLQFPLLIIGSRVYQGLDAIRENLREAFLTAGEDIFENNYVYWPSLDGDAPLFERYSPQENHATLVYFYRLSCEECAKLSPFIQSLPETVFVEGKEVPLDVIRINTRSGNNNARVAAFFEQYGVPPEAQSVPIVFLRDQYFSGSSAIESKLLPALSEGGGQSFVFPER